VGSIGLFAILAAVMYFSRKIDWNSSNSWCYLNSTILKRTLNIMVLSSFFISIAIIYPYFSGIKILQQNEN
jgi:hypothetical protein